MQPLLGQATFFSRKCAGVVSHDNSLKVSDASSSCYELFDLDTESEAFCGVGIGGSNDCFSVQQSFYVQTQTDTNVPSYWAQDIIVFRQSEPHGRHATPWEVRRCQ